jgi:hypothetical protein
VDAARRAVAFAFLMIVWAACGRPAFADARPIEAFFGHYSGTAIVEGDGDTTVRDLDVAVEPHDGNFQINWSTVTRIDDGAVKRKSYAIVFEPSARSDIYRSAMRTDLFGHRVPLDPLQGDPYVWCRIDGQTLTVYALNITNDGGYDLQVYNRTLVDKGLKLVFTRMREGRPTKSLSAFLEKVDGDESK